MSVYFRFGARAVFAFVVLGLPAAATGNVLISASATRNISCSGGVCTPTARNAVLNAADLTNYLANGNIEVTTTGSGVQANNIEIVAPISWSSGNTLSLEAFDSIRVEQPVTVTGDGGLSVADNIANIGGTFSFGRKGKIAFSGVSNPLSINGLQYALVATLPELAAAIAANTDGAYALSQDYNAGRDGKYHSSPIITIFEGNFNGLGNTISNLRIHTSRRNNITGLFSGIDTLASISSLHVYAVDIDSSRGVDVGGLVGFNEGMIFNTSVEGTVSAHMHSAGGIGGVAGQSIGPVQDVASSVRVRVRTNGRNSIAVGGIFGAGEGTISESYASKPVVTSGTSKGDSVGALVGTTNGTVENCYATDGALEAGGGYADVGGLIGTNASTVTSSYSIGSPAAGPNSDVGGLIGYDTGGEKGDIKNTYWDTTTSGITNLSQGAGNVANDPGIEGKTTTELTKALPKGFNHSIWAENPKINNGLPYLINNPPF